MMPSPFKVFGIIGTNATFWHVSLGGALASFAGYGIGQFIAPYWMRVYGFDLMTAALIYGGVLGVAAGIGTIGSGIVADRVRTNHPNSDSWLPALGMTLCVPLMIFGYNIDAFMGVSGVWLAVPVLVVAAILRYSYLAPMFAVTQKLVEPRMRATAAALLLFVVNLIGYGFGPPVVGAISDAGSRWQLSQLDAAVTLSECGAIEKELKAGTVTIPDAETLNESFCKPARKTGVRIGVTTGALFFLWAALHFLLMGKTLQRDQWTPEKDAATA
jgi:hypothetical protein